MKIGFFGGAFDPYHLEHKNIVLHAKEELGLDKVIVYPSNLPPHKTCAAPFQKRLELLKRAVKPYDFIIVDDIEGTTGKVNPTVEILPLLQKKYPCDESFFIIGGDSLLKFDTWIRPQEIAKMTKIAVVARENREEVLRKKEETEKKYGADVTVLDYVGKSVSSSLIKAHIELGDKPDGLDEETYEIIRELGLYGERKALIEKQKAFLKPERYEHVKRTTYYALKLNVNLGLNYDKVFTAAFFHDCAKPIKREIPGVPAGVVHQFVGPEIAKNEYGICDEEVLNAIGCHTTGKPGMTTLEKLIFCADMLEEGRKYDGVEKLRELIEKDFEKGFFACVKATYELLTSQRRDVHPLTKMCFEYYNNLYV